MYLNLCVLLFAAVAPAFVHNQIVDVEVQELKLGHTPQIIRSIAREGENYERLSQTAGVLYLTLNYKFVCLNY
ncbi:unnamed protein product [Nippostrongylus brasiliensis]|uniref:Secreted protein n=1 Tax=Nippostrongylus brasiliensis TaxID=27835 RepID=A0A0N4XXK7_NIPBR|nr:unnamed protein product [Nippostrongylus brasiliensis]